MSAKSPSNTDSFAWINPTPSPSPRSPRSARSARSAESPNSVLTPEKSPPKGWMTRQMQKFRYTRNNLLAKTMNVNKEVAKMNHKKDLLLTQINNSLYKRGWLTQTTDGKIVGLEYIPESSYLLYPSKTQLNKSTVKAFFPLKTSEFDRFLVFKASIHPDGSRTMGYEKIDIDFLQPSFLHRLNPLTSNPNVRRLVNRMKQYNKLVERSMNTGGRKITMKRKLNKRKTTKILSKNKKIKSTYKKRH